MLKHTYEIPKLPPPIELETKAVLKALAKANRALAELKGRAPTIPNEGLLIDALVLQEAKASSEVENIVTTQDELFRADVIADNANSMAAKEVALYRDALKLGYDRLRKTGGLIANNTLIEMFQLLLARGDGFRTMPGIALKNGKSGDVVYVPPQNADEIARLMTDLERFVNVDDICGLDPLIKMAVIHHQFESIHPFPDGNGRIGRILNVLYLTKTELLEIPVLYLSRYVTENKGEYYRLLQAVRDTAGAAAAWQAWILYMLDAVATTADITIRIVKSIGEQMAGAKRKLRADLPQLYSQELLNTLFRHPYTRIEFIMKDLDVVRQTAAKYLDALVAHDFLLKKKIGTRNYYININLVALFLDYSAAGGAEKRGTS